MLPRFVLPLLVLAAATTACSSSDDGSTSAAGGVPSAPERPAGVKLCYSTVADQHPAVAQFRSTFAAGDKDGRASAITALEGAMKDLPNEEEPALLLGLANLWRVAEPLDSESQGDIVKSALDANTDLTRAQTLCPTDARIAAWLGPVLVNTGRALNNQDTVNQGLAVLDQGIAAYPSFVLFSKLLVYANQPANDPDFQSALSAVADDTAACGAMSNDPACLDGATVPHNIEGASVFMGDVFAKAGKKDDAARYYRAGTSGPAFDAWPFSDLLNQRIATLDARITAETDSDTSNDPDEIWASTSQCAVCHTR